MWKFADVLNGWSQSVNDDSNCNGDDMEMQINPYGIGKWFWKTFSSYRNLMTSYYGWESLIVVIKQTFPPIIWIFTEGDGIESRIDTS